jgi:hypothetical protein
MCCVCDILNAINLIAITMGGSPDFRYCRRVQTILKEVACGEYINYSDNLINNDFNFRSVYVSSASYRSGAWTTDRILGYVCVLSSFLIVIKQLLSFLSPSPLFLFIRGPRRNNLCN